MKNGGRLFRRPKLTLSCSAEGKEGRKEGRKENKQLHRDVHSLNNSGDETKGHCLCNGLCHRVRIILEIIFKKEIRSLYLSLAVIATSKHRSFFNCFPHGVRLSPLGTRATVWPVVPAPVDR
jgi:hypothetical protein